MPRSGLMTATRLATAASAPPMSRILAPRPENLPNGASGLNCRIVIAATIAAEHQAADREAARELALGDAGAGDRREPEQAEQRDVRRAGLERLQRPERERLAPHRQERQEHGDGAEETEGEHDELDGLHRGVLSTGGWLRADRMSNPGASPQVRDVAREPTSPDGIMGRPAPDRADQPGPGAPSGGSPPIPIDTPRARPYLPPP